MQRWSSKTNLHAHLLITENAKTTHSPTKEQLARDARKEQLLIIRKWRIYYITNEIAHGFFPLSGEKTRTLFTLCSRIN